MTIPSEAAAWASKPEVADVAKDVPPTWSYGPPHDDLRAQIEALRVDVAAQQALVETLQTCILSLQTRVTRTEIRLRLE
jgi:hypothetical protein